MNAADNYETYTRYAKKYGISRKKPATTCFGRRQKKTSRELTQAIYFYEKKHGVKDGLYF